MSNTTCIICSPVRSWGQYQPGVGSLSTIGDRSCYVGDMKDREFANWLKAEMRSRGWSASEVGRRVGVRRQTVYKWMQSERLPKPENAAQFADVMGVHVDAVLTLARIRPQVEPIARFDQERRLREMEASIQELRNIGTGVEIAIPLIGIAPADSVRWAAVEDLHETIFPSLKRGSLPMALHSLLSGFRGDCLMALGIIDGDIVVIERLQQSEVRDGDVVLLRIDGNYTLKQWRDGMGGIDLCDGQGNIVRHLTIMDDFEVVGVTRFRFGRTR